MLLDVVFFLIGISLVIWGITLVRLGKIRYYWFTVLMLGITAVLVFVWGLGLGILYFSGKLVLSSPSTTYSETYFFFAVIYLFSSISFAVTERLQIKAEEAKKKSEEKEKTQTA